MLGLERSARSGRGPAPAAKAPAGVAGQPPLIRAALESGADPAVVASSMAEVKGETLAAERDLNVPGAQRLTKAEIKALVRSLKDIVKVPAHADRADKAAVYADLGIRLTYPPDERRVPVEAAPSCTTVPVGEANSMTTA